MFMLTFIIASVIAFMIKNIFCAVDTLFKPEKDKCMIYSVIIRVLAVFVEIVVLLTLLRVVAILKIYDLIDGFWIV
mgnify:FL=1